MMLMPVCSSTTSEAQFDLNGCVGDVRQDARKAKRIQRTCENVQIVQQIDRTRLAGVIAHNTTPVEALRFCVAL
jgi:hypothetical protein